MNRLFATQLLVIAVCGTIISTARADVEMFWTFDDWQQAVGSFSTIDFTGWPDHTLITDQYSHFGVTFTDGNDFIVNWGFDTFKDGSGLHGSWADRIITVEFNSPQLWIGVDHPGSAAFDLYYQDELIATAIFSQNGAGNFSGVISEHLFDKAVIYRITNTAAVIDDLHWGIPAPGALAVLGFAALLGPSRRRRHGATRLRDDGHRRLA